MSRQQPLLSAPRTNSGSTLSRDTQPPTTAKSSISGKNNAHNTYSFRRAQQANLRVGSGSNDGKSQRSGVPSWDKANVYEDAACTLLYPLLTPNQLHEVRSIFNHYVSSYADEPPAHSSVPDALSETPAQETTPESSERRGPASSASPPPQMNVRALMAFFADIEMPKTTYEVRDLIASMLQPESSGASSKQAAQEADTESCREVDPARSVAPMAPKSGGDATLPGPEPGVSFMHFLHLFCTMRDAPSQLPLSTSQKPNNFNGDAGATIGGKDRAVNEDILDVFRMADADRDGAITVADICALVNSLLGDGHVCDEVQQLARMEPAELRVALGELDVDGDGVVTQNDFCMVMKTM